MDTLPTSFTKKIKTYSLILTLLCHSVLLLLLLFQCIWVFGGSETAIIHQTTLQTARVNALVKYAEIVAYRPINEHTSAITEMQIILPIFDEAQNGLINGDSSLQLPSSINRADISSAVAEEQNDFKDIDAISKTIISTKIATNDQITLLLTRSRTYSMNSDLVTLSWKNRIDSGFFVLFLIEAVLTILAAILVFFKHTFVTSKMLERIEHEQVRVES